MPKRQVFFSFRFSYDSWRASQVRNMGEVDESSTFCDNDWEEIKEKSEENIKKWIDAQLAKRSCLVVLIGEHTDGRKYIKYEIQKAYELKKGILGIYINKLKDSDGVQAKKGKNPLDEVYAKDGKKLSSHVTTFESNFSSSTYVYDDIKERIEDLIEQAIEEKETY